MSYKFEREWVECGRHEDLQRLCRYLGMQEEPNGGVPSLERMMLFLELQGFVYPRWMVQPNEL